MTRDSTHHLPVAPNRLNRDFTPSAPNQTWKSDMTYLWTDEGWLSLAIVLDLFNREVVGWSLKPRMTAGHRDRRADDGMVPTETGRGAAASLGSGQSVRQPTLPGQADGLRHGGLHESQGKLLGSRAYRELVQQC